MLPAKTSIFLALYCFSNYRCISNFQLELINLINWLSNSVIIGIDGTCNCKKHYRRRTEELLSNKMLAILSDDRYFRHSVLNFAWNFSDGQETRKCRSMCPWRLFDAAAHIDNQGWLNLLIKWIIRQCVIPEVKVSLVINFIDWSSYSWFSI